MIFSKSEEEFFDRLKESDISFDFNLADYIDRKIPTDEKVISARFDEVGKAFTEFAYAIANEGFYTCLAKDCSEISKLCVCKSWKIFKRKNFSRKSKMDFRCIYQFV